jgi:uncharacterized protein YndB with AHSA1/START domain
MFQSNGSPISARELTFERMLDASADKLFRAWTEPDLLQKWFCPRPWTVSSAQLDVRPGGASLVTMRSPEGQDVPNRGVYLEVVKNERLVFTDAFVEAWVPSERAFMVVTITFEAQGAKTRYSARIQHWNVTAREEHENMGFHAGWAIATDQLTELVATL